MTVRPILLDTCALLWITHRDPLATAASDALEEASRERGTVLVSPITAWEVGQAVAKGRIKLALEPLRWFETALEAGLALASMPPSVLVESSFLPHARLRDPADKILAATARAFDYRLMTRDRSLLDYASEGHLQAITC